MIQIFNLLLSLNEEPSGVIRLLRLIQDKFKGVLDSDIFCKVVSLLKSGSSFDIPNKSFCRGLNTIGCI